MNIYVGTVCAFGFNFAPVGWAFCQGQTLPISDYQVLFALIGTTYGGDGVTTFGVPNLMGKAAIHYGQGPATNNYSIGQSGGFDVTTLTVANMPAHAHVVTTQMSCANTAGSSGLPTNGYLGTGIGLYATGTPPVNTYMAPPTVNLANTGASQPLSIGSPSLVVNYCISLFGIYPSRN